MKIKTKDYLNKSSLSVLMLMLAFSAGLWGQCETINLACNDQINVSINEDCYASINVDLLLENPPTDVFPDDGVNYEITLLDAYGFPIVPSNQVGEDYVGQTLTASIELVPCGISCWGYIHVEDKIGPKFWNCVNASLPDIEIDCIEYSNGFDIPEPTLGGICDALDELTFEDDTISLGCNDNFAIQIFRNWVATDASGNSTNCNQTISVEKFDLADVVMPNDTTIYLSFDDDCEASADPSITGEPSGLQCPNIMHYYTDIDYPQCGRQVKLLRDWFVIDWCTGQSITQGQIVKIIDDRPPVTTCPPDTVRVSYDHYNCYATPILNPYRVQGYDTLGSVLFLEECSFPVDVEVAYLEAEEGVIAPLTGPYITVQRDTNNVYPFPSISSSVWVRYCFTDDCGNSTTADPDPTDSNDNDNTCCYFLLEAEDNDPPTAICEGFTKVQLNSDGEVEVPAITFDDNSFDPCGGVSHFEVKREAFSCPGYDENGVDAWGESVHFCCEDLGDTITIRLRVFDTEGNFSECLGTVCVSDPRTPEVICPADVSLDCGDDFRDHDLIGLPTGLNGCNGGIRLGLELFDLSDYDDACGLGTITRTIEVNDLSGNLIKICEQKIYFDGNSISKPLEPGDFVFPADITLDVCVSGGSLDPVFTGIPTTTESFGCANIAISYDDDTPYVQNTNGVCYTIFREWKVVDWCNYHPSVPNQHILTGIQEIRVVNTATPIFDCPQDFTIDAHGSSCEVEVPLSVTISSNCNTGFDIVWSVDENSDGVFDRTGFGNDATDVYPVGEHTIRFVGQNQCDGTPVSCTYTFTVVGDSPPLPICLGNVTWSLGSNGTTVIWASDFDLKSEAGCGQDSILFSFVPPTDQSFPVISRAYTCADVPNGVSEDIEVILYVVDEEGRYSSCSSMLNLQDSQNACPDLGGFTIVGGAVRTEYDEPMQEVMIEMNNMDDGGYAMAMTKSNGSYAFESLSTQQDYSFQPSYDGDYLNGVSTLDLVLMQRHILGIEKLDSPYKIIAADVDNSGSLSAIDLINLRKLILGVIDELPEQDAWTFVPGSHQFLDPTAPWGYNSMIEYYDLEDEHMDANFIAVKIGDVNNSADLQDSDVIEKRNSKTLYLSTYNQPYAKGDLISIPLIAEDNMDLQGMQFTFHFDHANMIFEGIDNGAINVNDDNFALLNNKDGVITFSFNYDKAQYISQGESLMTLYFEAAESMSSLNEVKISSQVTKSELYDSNYNISNIELVKKDSDHQISNGLEVYQNEPNPFTNSTRIAFSIPSRDWVKLSVMNASGQIVFEQEREFEAGVGHFEVLGQDLNSAGVLLYRIESGNAAITKKMIVLK